jgi:hypothetical protein
MPRPKFPGIIFLLAKNAEIHRVPQQKLLGEIGFRNMGADEGENYWPIKCLVLDECPRSFNLAISVIGGGL